MIFVLPLLLYFALIFSRLHGHAIFGVMSVSDVLDTGTGTTLRIPVSGECPLSFFFFTFLRHGSDVSDMPAVKKKK